MNPSTPNEPSTLEPVPVQLTRMEGSINLIVERVGNVQGQIGELKSQVESLASRVTTIELSQAASSGSSGFLKAWLPTVVAAIGVLAALGFGVKFGG